MKQVCEKISHKTRDNLTIYLSYLITTKDNNQNKVTYIIFKLQDLILLE